MSKLHIGTCSWKYDSWEGLVYSSANPKNYLQEYAKKFGSVEIDQWFWSLFGENQVVLPKLEVVEEYAASVPEQFQFTIKVPNSLTLTHFYNRNKSDPLVENPHFLSPELFHRFLDSLQPLQGKIGAFVFQFEYLNLQKMSSQVEFLRKMDSFLNQIESKRGICIETRNPNYLNPSYFQLLNEHKIGHTFCQGYYMPDIVQVYEDFADQIRGTQVIRLLGSDRKGIEKTTQKKWNRIVDPKDSEIPGISRMISKMLAQDGMDVYLNVNNHYEGAAPSTIEKFISHLSPFDIQG